MHFFSQIMSPTSWFLILSLQTPSWMMLFSPSWHDIGLLFAVELCAFLLIYLMSRRLRAPLALLLLQSLPAAYVLLFVWEPKLPTAWHWGMVGAVLALTRIYGLGCAFIEGHVKVARMKAERAETLVLLSVLGFHTGAVYVLLATHAEGADYPMALVAFQMFVCFVMITHFQFLAKRSRFSALNDVTRRLEEKERELACWVMDHAERQRMATFGEVAGLLVHDLANPIHTVAFCAEALKENLQPSKRESYLEIIIKNCEKVSSLIRSLRAYLKKGEEGHVRLLTVHEHAVDILSLQFATKNFRSVKLEWDHALDEVWLKIASNEIIHILLNIYANAVRNFLEHGTAEPCIHTTLCQRENGFVTFAVSDNGEGLSPDEFQNLITLGFTNTSEGRKEWPGLRLGFRLLEQHGGSVHLDEAYFQEGRGTRLLLKLPLCQAANAP